MHEKCACNHESFLAKLPKLHSTVRTVHAQLPQRPRRPRHSRCRSRSSSAIVVPTLPFVRATCNRSLAILAFISAAPLHLLPIARGTAVCTSLMSCVRRHFDLSDFSKPDPSTGSIRLRSHGCSNRVAWPCTLWVLLEDRSTKSRD